MKRIAILITALATLTATVTSSQSRHPYSLQELLNIGLEQNYAVRIVRNSQQISDNNVTLANAGFLPEVGLTGGYTGRVENTRTTPVSGAATNDNGVYNQSANLGLNANWDIFDGFRVQTNYDRLQELQRQGELETRITIEDFIASLTAEYYNYIQQRIRLRNYVYAVTLSKERLRIVETRLSVKSGSGLDVLQARVDFNADSSMYMNQQTLVAQSRIRINELIASEDVNARLFTVDTLICFDGELQYPRLEEQTRSNNASLLASAKDITLAELDLKTLKSRNYPYLGMGAGYGYTWNRYGNGTTRQRGVLGFNAGASLSMTIFDGNRRREQRNAGILINTAELRQQELEQQVLSDLAILWQSYRNYLEIIRLEEENLIAAKKNHEIAMERYLLGDLAGIEMREAQQSLLDAEERILGASYNTKLCEISLLQISGNVLSYLDGN